MKSSWRAYARSERFSCSSLVPKGNYSNRAKAMKLPNAYTAALTDYMRKP